MLGVKLSWGLLDIFVGSCCARFVPHKNESEFTKYVGDAGTPGCTAFVKASLAHQYFADRVCEKFPKPVDVRIRMVITDLALRGLGNALRCTFAARIRAIALLLENIEEEEDAKLWNVRRCTEMPARDWSPQQAEVLRLLASASQMRMLLWKEILAVCS